MKKVYGYIRVSSAKQGIKGVSLTEQKDAIERYAEQNNLSIVSWFEDRETAAKRGRTAFTKLLSLLRSGEASGVIIHKIDRSARNLRDWAELVDLADQGVDVHFVNESIDMGVRGGRLSADIQAVVAADYIRNLREETIKGMRGRLKQGLYPMRAPIGYLDMGGGKLKEIDPIKGPIIKELFERYATGEDSLKSLLNYARKRGLTNLHGGELTMNGMSTILHNQFYTGVIYIRRTGDSYVGKHEPIIDQKTFNTVQQILQGKTVQGKGKHEYTFRRMFGCTGCDRSLIAERQKGHVYYRCHLCRGVSLREDTIEASILNAIKYSELTQQEIEEVEQAQQGIKTHAQTALNHERKSLTLGKESLEARLSKLTDAYLDEALEKDLYLKKKAQIVQKIQSVETRLAQNSQGISEDMKIKVTNLELYKSLYFSYISGNSAEKRKLLREVTSNRSVSGKNVVLELYSPFQELLDIKKMRCCDPHRGWSRTSRGKLAQRATFREKLDEWIKKPLAEDAPQSP